MKIRVKSGHRRWNMWDWEIEKRFSRVVVDDDHKWPYLTLSITYYG